MQQFVAGDEDAFAHLIHKYQNPLLNFFLRLGVERVRAEDFSQDVFLRLYSYRLKYKPRSTLNPFLFTLVRHIWVDWLRKEGRHKRYVTHVIEKEQRSVKGTLDAHLDIQTALDQLSEKLRMVVVLNVYQGLKYAEISEVLDIPVGTVKSRMHLAMIQMREVFNDDKASE